MIFTINGCSIDTEAYEIKRGSVPIPAEPQVFDLLVLLLENSDRLVTKDELIERVWQGRIVSDATVSSRIKAARAALGDDGSVQHCIRTVRRRGYRMVGSVTRSEDGEIFTAVEPEAAASGVEARPDLPDKPSIAVLPFVNMSRDGEQDFLADGLAEDIITALSRMPWFFVIARNSSFAYRDQDTDVQDVSAKLGVRYVLRGSLRRAGNRLRVSAQLVDAVSGSHVWADRYDRDMINLFDVQDEVTRSIVGAVVPQFLSSEARRAKRKNPADLDAWECVMRGRAHLWKLGRSDAAEARRLFERAMALSPDGNHGIGDLALVHFLEGHYRWSDAPELSHRKMLATAEKAVAADDTDPLALTILAWANIVAHRWDDALPPVDRAIEISPNFAPAIGMRGTIHALLGEADRGVACLQTAMRLSPLDGFMPFWLMGLAWANHALGDYEASADAARRAIQLAPDNPTFRRQLAAAYANLGRMEEARDAVADYLRIAPGHTLEDARRVSTRVEEHRRRYIDALRQAGLPA